MPAGEPLIELSGVTKDYRALRPLRIERLELRAGLSVALLGVDAAMSEVLVNLITGAQLPDEGEVRVFGRSTRSITSVDDWVGELDRFGLISDRAVLVEQLTAEQNLAMPLSLQIDDIPQDVRSATRQLAAEVGLSDDELARPTGAIGRAAQLRLRLGRALALSPKVLLAEHPNAALTSAEGPPFAADFARIAAVRHLAAAITTMDADFARTAADLVLEFQPATGALRQPSSLRRWFSFRNRT